MSIRSFITAIVLFCAVSVAAQTEMPVAVEAPAKEKMYPRVTGWEFQWDPIDYNTTFTSEGEYKACPVWGTRFELRRNLKNSPWSVGGMLSLYFAERYSSRVADEYGEGHMGLDGHSFLLVGPTVNYDFRRGSLFNPYAEASTGLGFWFEEKSPYLHAGVGLELLHFIRIGVGATAIGYNSSTWGINLAIVIGGWKR